MLYIDSANDFDEYKVIISAPFAGVSITGLIDDDEFSYTGSAEIGSSTIAASVEGVTKGVAQAVASKLPGGDMFRNMVADNFKTVKSTIKGYDGAANNTFSVSMHIFPNKMGNGSYKDIELNMAKLTQPNIKSLGDQLTSYLYDPTSTTEFLTGGDPFKGKLVFLSIGNWFKIQGDLFVENIPRNYAKWQDTTGKPIYMKATFNFITYRVMNAEEMSGWLLK